MTRYWPVMLLGMLLVPGCKRAERTATDTDGGDTTLPTQSAQALRSAAPMPPRPPDSVQQFPWQDTTAIRDTTRYRKGHDTRTVTWTRSVDSVWYHIPLPSVVTSGVPFGLFATWDSVQLTDPDLFSLSYGNDQPGILVARIDTARKYGVRMMLILTGGARRNYLSKLPNPLTSDPTDSVWQFDPAKWKAKMRTFNTPAIRAKVTQAYEQGLITGSSVIDEPFNTGGGGIESNSWGPPGIMNKARVDSLCQFGKDSIMPGIPHGMFQDWSIAQNQTYRVCDFQMSQYRTVKGSITAYRDNMVKECNRQGMGCASAINVNDGGKQDRDGTYDCKGPDQGGLGGTPYNCRMTPEQIKTFGLALGTVSCALSGWKRYPDMLADPKYRAAFKAVTDSLRNLPPKPCKRRS